jgi:small-conductance mechanosensitive channel
MPGSMNLLTILMIFGGKFRVTLPGYSCVVPFYKNMRKPLFFVVITAIVLGIIALVLGYYAFWGYLAWQWIQPHSFWGFVWFSIVWSVLNYAATYLIKQVLGILRKFIPALDAALKRREKDKVQKPGTHSNTIYDDFEKLN